MTTQEIKETVKEIKGYNVVLVDFGNNTFVTDKKCVYAFDLTKSNRLKSNSIKFLYTITNFNNCSY